MKKVLIISIKIDPPIDNANKAVVVNLVSNIKDVFLTVLTSKDSNNHFFRDAENISIESIYDKTRHPMTFIQKVCLVKRFMFKRDRDVDIYHCLLEPTRFSIQFLKLLLMLRRKKSVITLLNKIEDVTILNKLYFFDRIVVSSDYMKKVLTNMGFQNVVRIYPSVDLKKFRPVKNNGNTFWHKKFNLNQDPVVLYAGNYNPVHGIHDIEKAIPEVVRKIPNVKFIFACRSYFKQQFEERSRFIKRLKQSSCSKSVFFLDTIDSIKDLLVTADILLFPMRKVQAKSAIPIILLEALALEIPIIITDIQPLNEVMKEKVGLFVPVENPKSIADSIIKLLKDGNLREELGKQGRKVVEKYFSAEEQGRQYSKIYSEIG